MEKNKEQAVFLNQQGENLFAQDDALSAYDSFIEALKIDPNFATAHNNLGVVCWEKGDSQEAIDHFLSALKIDPNDRDAVLNICEIWKEMGKLEEGKNILSTYLHQNPGDSKILMELEDKKRPQITWEDLQHLPAIRLYAGDIPEEKEYDGLIGLSLTRNDHGHIKHDITKPLPLPDNSIDSYQAEDVFEHIEYDRLLPVIDEIYRVLKPGSTFRLSIPDYGCDVLINRSVRDEFGSIVFDPGGGGTQQSPGHVWFPRIDNVKELLEKSTFGKFGKIESLHYYNMDGTFIVNKIDYSKGHIQRTPDFDKRVQNPYRPMSIVIDLTKDEKEAHGAIILNEEGEDLFRNGKEDLRLLQINTFYDKYLEDIYSRNPDLGSKMFDEQISMILRGGFSAIHNYVPYIDKLGYESRFIIANCYPSQRQWLKEHDLKLHSEQNWVQEITRRQIEIFKPDVLLLSDAFLFDSRFIKQLSARPKLIAGWSGEFVLPGIDWSEFDMILSNFRYVCKQALELGAKTSEYFHPGFAVWLRDEVTDQSPEYDVVFVGQWSDLHRKRNELIAEVAREAVQTGNFSVGLYLSGDRNSMPPEVQECCRGERFGLEMHRALRSGRIGLNGETTPNVEIIKEAGNMRMFETTGTGVFLLTPYYTNITDYFIPGQEIEIFHDKNEMIEKIYYYLEHPEKREEIARCGQERCLRDYSMEGQLAKLDRIFRRHLTEGAISPSDTESSGGALAIKAGTGLGKSISNNKIEYEVIVADDDLSNIKKIGEANGPGNWQVKFRGHTVHCRDLLSFYTGAKDIFLQHIYDFECLNESPTIIDGGGHIGLFTLFVKQKYPNAKITVFEPDDESWHLLNRNIKANGISSVNLVKAGLYKFNGEIEFSCDHSDGSSIFGEKKNASIKVVKLSEYIKSEFDFLKLNIEGSELDVIAEIETKLPLVKEMVIEYHGFPEIGQNLHKLLSILDRAGFRYMIHDFDAETNPATKPPFKLDKSTRFFLLIHAKRLFTPQKPQSLESNFAEYDGRIKPISRLFGFDRGVPIDRYYIEKFLKHNSPLIRGRVLEIAENAYTKQFGSDVTKSDVLNVVSSPDATIVGDLATGNNIPQAAFDCIILTQTINVIFDVTSTLKNAIKALKPSGTLLLTAPGISQISRFDMDRWGDYWRYTDKSLKTLLSEVVPEESIQVESFGNVAVAKAFLDGLALHELSKEILDYRDEDYQVLLTCRVTKPASKPDSEYAVLQRTKSQISFTSPLILLYHRVANDPVDAQLLAVSPENFEAHLKELAKNYRVLPLCELIRETGNGGLRPDTVAITFDDGYLDNLTNAVPVLEKCGLHATVFVTSGMVGSEIEFWWDAMERVFLLGNGLPKTLSIYDSDSKAPREWDLSTAQNRLMAYDELCAIVSSQPANEKAEFVENLISWAGLALAPRESHRILDPDQLSKLAASSSIEIGSHTVSHARLSELEPEEQRQEICRSKEQLEAIIKKPVRLISYPFGLSTDFTKETAKMVFDAGYEAGIANVQGNIVEPVDLYSIPRRLVRNWTGETFASWLREKDKDRLEFETLSGRAQHLIDVQSK